MPTYDEELSVLTSIMHRCMASSGGLKEDIGGLASEMAKDMRRLLAKPQAVDVLSRSGY